MPGLSIVILTDDGERARGALVTALGYAALGGGARLFFQLDAVALLAPDAAAPRDAAHRAAGLPDLAGLIAQALDAGIGVAACQTGLDLAALDPAQLDPRIEAGGPLSFLAEITPESRLLLA